MKSLIVFLLFSLSSSNLWACPMCAGSGMEKDEYTVPLLVGFILLTTIPFLVIFRLIRKYREQGREKS
ncbi:MAG: hypothetical protein OXB88_05025 [Bacteriovoracales bacterium]|nr:hypothetical protein [Bacteriovoracales bacterium]